MQPSIKKWLLFRNHGTGCSPARCVNRPRHHIVYKDCLSVHSPRQPQFPQLHRSWPPSAHQLHHNQGLPRHPDCPRTHRTLKEYWLFGAHEVADADAAVCRCEYRYCHCDQPARILSARCLHCAQHEVAQLHDDPLCLHVLPCRPVLLMELRPHSRKG